MATAQTIPAPTPSAPHAATLLVSVASMPREALAHLVETLRAAFATQPGSLIVASPDAATSPDDVSSDAIRLVGYTPQVCSRLAWTNTAADFLNAYDLLQQHPARGVLLLGAGAETLPTEALRHLAAAVCDHANDLAVPHYTQPPRAGLVNSAILYPLSRALFGSRARFPLALDLALSARMIQRLATAAQRFTAANQPDALLWPIAEAATASYAIAEVEAGTRALPQPSSADLNTLLAQVTGSLFADLDLKAAAWQRTRVAPPLRPAPASHSPILAAPPLDEIQPMLDTFRLAYSNLREIWSLVLPPQTLFGLKRLAEMPPASFRMADSLWARIVFDFMLAFRLRTINRGHLLGALTPLYLAWVASHILLTAAGTPAEAHVEAQAAAFEADKTYLVSRWRWPDRFNP